MAEIAAPSPTPTGPQRPRSRRRSVLLAVVLGSAIALVLLAGLTAYYVATRKPVTELPPVEVVSRPIPPRRLFDFAGVASPIGITVSPDGQRVYVAEGGGQRLIKVFDRDGRPTGELAPPDSKPGYRKPGHLALDATGRLYVVDRLRAAVDVYAPALQASTKPLAAGLRWMDAWQPAAIKSLGGWLPNGVSVGPDGRVYVAEIGLEEQSVFVLAPDGTLIDRLSKSTGVPGGFNYPVQAVADGAGRVYVSDGGNGRVVAVSPRGVQATGGGGPGALSLPRGLTLHGQRLFVADAAANRIAVFSAGDRPQFLHAFGDTADSEGLAYPNAVAVDQTGRIYVADRANHRVEVWAY